MHTMTKLLSETDYNRMIFHEGELLVEEAHGYDCAAKRRWLPAQRPYETDVLNQLLKQAIIDNYTEGRYSGVVFCGQVNATEMVRIVLQPASLHTFSEHIETSSTRDGMGEQIWYEVEDRTVQNTLLEAVLIELCRGS
jgi:hypothetical protein